MDNDQEQDVRAARVYLGGYVATDARGVPAKRFYPEGSKDSDYCRQALARVLRSDKPLDRQLRRMLADMFEPGGPEPVGWRNRKLTASNRSTSRPRDYLVSTHLVEFVWHRVQAGRGVDAAISEAIDKFEVSRERLYKLWRQYKPLLERIYGPLPRKEKLTPTMKRKRER